MRYLALFVCTVFSIILNSINILVNDVFHSLSYDSLKDQFPEIFLYLLISHHNRKIDLPIFLGEQKYRKANDGESH